MGGWNKMEKEKYAKTFYQSAISILHFLFFEVAFFRGMVYAKTSLNWAIEFAYTETVQLLTWKLTKILSIENIFFSFKTIFSSSDLISSMS